tara:strand:- start:264 stop:698 length:435 start_codon:yes stop_codon:yes gene_type:complete
MARKERKRFVKGNEKPFRIHRTSKGASIPNTPGVSPVNPGVIHNTDNILDYLPMWLHSFYLSNQALIHRIIASQRYNGSGNDTNLLNAISGSNGDNVNFLVGMARRQLPIIVRNIEATYNQQQVRIELGHLILAVIIGTIIKKW